MAKTFGLVAYAAETGEVIQPFDGKIVFDSGSGCNDLEKGFFAGCLFRVTGDGIRTVSASIDRGNIYRTKTVEGQGDDWVRALHQGTAPEIDGADEVFIWGMHDDETNYADLCWKLDNGFTDAYDPDASYGFWLPAYESSPDADLTQEWQNSVARLEGAALSVTVTFDDGTSQTRTLKLHTGKLKVEYPEDGSGAVLTGELAGDNESYLYGVYADLES